MDLAKSMLTGFFLISFIFVCEGVTNQNKYSTINNAIVTDTYDKNPTNDLSVIRDSGNPIKFDDVNKAKPINFVEHTASSSNPLKFKNDFGSTSDIYAQDTAVVAFHDENNVEQMANHHFFIEEGNNVLYAEGPLKFPLSDNKDTVTNPGPLKFSYAPGPLKFSNDQKPPSNKEPAFVYVGPIKYTEDIPETNVHPTGTSQFVFQKDQNEGAQNQELQLGSAQGPGKKKRRRRRKRKNLQYAPVPEVPQSSTLFFVQDVLSRLVEDDQKKCVLRMFCEQAPEFPGQQGGAATSLRRAIASIVYVYNTLPILRQMFGANVERLASAVSAFAAAGLTGQTKGVAACRTAFPDCPSDPVEMANYLALFQRNFTSLFNGQQNPDYAGAYGYYQPNMHHGDQLPYQQSQDYHPYFQQGHQLNYPQGYYPSYSQRYQPSQQGQMIQKYHLAQYG